LPAGATLDQIGREELVAGVAEATFSREQWKQSIMSVPAISQHRQLLELNSSPSAVKIPDCSSSTAHTQSDKGTDRNPIELDEPAEQAVQCGVVAEDKEVKVEVETGLEKQTADSEIDGDKVEHEIEAAQKARGDDGTQPQTMGNLDEDDKDGERWPGQIDNGPPRTAAAHAWTVAPFERCYECGQTEGLVKFVSQVNGQHLWMEYLVKPGEAYWLCLDHLCHHRINNPSRACRDRGTVSSDIVRYRESCQNLLS
jgi:hypothetical protein